MSMISVRIEIAAISLIIDEIPFFLTLLTLAMSIRCLLIALDFRTFLHNIILFSTMSELHKTRRDL